MPLSISLNVRAKRDEIFDDAQASAVGGVAPYTYAIQSGTLPAGVNLDPDTGLISGTPTVGGTFSGIVVRVTDASSSTADLAPFTLKVSTIADVAINFGAKTRSGHGGYPVGVGRTIVGGVGAGDWTVDTHGAIVPSGTFGAAKVFSSSSYALTLDNGAAVDITMVPNAYHVAAIATGTNADTASAFQLKSVILLGAEVKFGDTIYLRDGVYNENQASLGGKPFDWTVRRAAGGQFTQRVGGPVAPISSSPSEGWVVVRSENPRGATIRQITFEARDLPAQYLRITDVKFERLNTAAESSAYSLHLQAGSPNLLLSWMLLDNNEFCSAINSGDYGFADQIGGGVRMLGSLSSGATMANVFFWNNDFHDLYNGIITEGSKFEFVGNTVSRVWNDCMKGRVTEFKINWNRFVDKKYVPDGVIHGDFIQQQWGSTSIPAGAYQMGEIIGNIFMRGAGNNGCAGGGCPDGQGIFISGADLSGAVLTGLTIRGNFMNIAKVHAIYLEGGLDANVEWNTCTSAVVIDPGKRLISQQAATVGGSWRYNVAENLGLSTGTITPNVTIASPTLGGAGAPYADVFVNPIIDATNDVDVMLARFSMKPSGPADGLIKSGAVGTGYVDYVNRTTSFPY